MDRLHTSTVTQDQIDHLGHMNVRFYTALACVGAGELTARLGPGGRDDPRIWERDIYVRHRREQLVGARLEVRGGVLEAAPDRIRVYEELADVDSGDVAATFVMGLEAIDEDRNPVKFSDEVVERAGTTTVEIPEHGMSRSISFDDEPAAPLSLDVLRARDLAQRQVRVLEAAECDEGGWFPSDMMMALVWGGEPLPGRDFRPFHTTPEGKTLAWATMETRAVWSRLPRLGDRVQSFNAEIGVGEKTFNSRYWVYDLDRGELVCDFSVVSLAFDLEARRSVVIPDALRDEMAQRLHPDLAHS